MGHNVIETTIEYKGAVLKISGGRVFARAFGTTINNHSMHWNWVEIPVNKLSNDLEKHLKENNLI